MKSDADYDVMVIGGSFAGMAAALQIARARRRVMVVDTGLRRNRFAASSHGFLAQDGSSPERIIREARRQLLVYPTVVWRDEQATAAGATTDGGFLVSFTGGATVSAKRLVLAFGVADSLPDIPGIRERWGKAVFHCPYCHGYELGAGRVGVLATGPASIHQAMLLPDWGETTLFTNGAVELAGDEHARLTSRGVAIEAGRVVEIMGSADLRMSDGRVVPMAGLFLAPRTSPANALAEQLGCALEEGPMGPFVVTDPMKRTSVPGVFACGDLIRPAGSVSLAVGDGALAGAVAHQSLIFE